MRNVAGSEPARLRRLADAARVTGNRQLEAAALAALRRWRETISTEGEGGAAPGRGTFCPAQERQ